MRFANYLLLLMFVVVCVLAYALSQRKHNAGTYSIVDSLVTHSYVKVTDTIVKPYRVVDTLVIIETSETRTFYVDTTKTYGVSGGWYMGSMNHFADGKTIDTDYRHIVHTKIIHRKDKPRSHSFTFHGDAYGGSANVIGIDSSGSVILDTPSKQK